MADAEQEVFGDPLATTPDVIGTPDDKPAEEPKPEEEVIGGDEPTPEPEEAPAEATPPVEDDKKKKTEEFYQTKYQAVVGRLKEQFGPEYMEQLLSDHALPPSDASKINLDELSEVEQLEHKIVNRLEKHLAEREQRQYENKVKQAYSREYLAADRAVAELRQAANLTDEQFQQIAGIVNTFGINIKQVGGPAGWASAFGQVASQFVRPNDITSASDVIRTEAAAKVEALNKVRQPGAAPIGLTDKTKLTKEEKYLKMMKDAGSNDANSEVFG